MKKKQTKRKLTKHFELRSSSVWSVRLNEEGQCRNVCVPFILQLVLQKRMMQIAHTMLHVTVAMQLVLQKKAENKTGVSQ